MKKYIILSVLTSFIITNAFCQNNKTPKIKDIKFGSITIDGIIYDKDIVIDNGNVRQRKKGPSKPLKAKYNHTPLTELEEIPWDCDTLVIAIGMYGSLPVTDSFKQEAEKRNVTLILLKTPEAAEYYMKNFSNRLNAIIHITC